MDNLQRTHDQFTHPSPPKRQSWSGRNRSERPTLPLAAHLILPILVARGYRRGLFPLRSRRVSTKNRAATKGFCYRLHILCPEAQSCRLLRGFSHNPCLSPSNLKQITFINQKISAGSIVQTMAGNSPRSLPTAADHQGEKRVVPIFFTT